MAEPFVGEIRMFGGNFAPRGWAYCDGQLLSISQNDALFSLLGTVYGGDGRTTFGLPDMRGRVPIHQGSGAGLSPRRLGATGGAESVILTANQVADHTHTISATTNSASDTLPTNKTLATAGANIYGSGTQSTLADSAVGNSPGSSQSHTNLMPTMCVNFIIALFGIYPSRS